MAQRALSSRKKVDPDIRVSVSAEELANARDAWLLDSEYRQLTKTTLELRRIVSKNALWFVRDRELVQLGERELKSLFVYMGQQPDERGRWGNPQQKALLKRETILTYHRVIRTWFRFLTEDGYLDESPMETLTPPRSQRDQIQPFTISEVEALLAQADKTEHAKRNKAILMALLDTGMRVSEICSIKMQDLDIHERKATITGKGQKRRMVYFQPQTMQAFTRYLREFTEERSPHDPLFVSERGVAMGGPLTRSGLFRMMSRLGKAAGINTTRCSPHTMRHTFAVFFLRNGGNVFSLKEQLGHTSLTICQRYLALAEADLQEQHRQYSPVTLLSAGGRGRKRKATTE